MVTLAKLCAEMERSQRLLTPRAARDWWTKGLLPRPQRRGLGRQKGTETFWVQPRVIDQANATYDLLARHSRTYTVRIGLWLLGFPVELKLVRSAWAELIERNRPHRGSYSGKMPLDDAVARLAAAVGPSLLRPQAPASLKHKATEVCVEFLSAFYGVDEEPETFGLAADLAATIPYWSNGASQPLSFDDAHIAWIVAQTRDWLSLPVQRQILRTANDHEFCRARRFLKVGLGILERTARKLPIDQRQALQQQSHIFVVIFGRMLLLPLIAALRDPSSSTHVPMLLRLSRGAKQQFPPFRRTAI